MLEVENVHAYYRGNEALKGVSLEVGQVKLSRLSGPTELAKRLCSTVFQGYIPIW
jgi:ABC-type branched-subunit amino acid transport system ATPase component